MRTKIKNVTEKTYQGKVTGYVIDLENGVQGYFNDKDSDNLAAVRGAAEVDYTLDVRKNKKGGEYNLLTLKVAAAPMAGSSLPEGQPPATPNPTVSSAGSLSEVKKLKVNAAVQIMLKAVEMFNEGKLEWDQIALKQREITSLVWTEIDEIYGIE